MFFAVGVSAYGAAIFHLMTHAFFKALLFLGSGSVIHAMSDEQDMRKMGGIWRMIPITYAVMWIGSLSLAGVGIPGVFGFSGFYSKDIVLEAAYGAHSGHGLFAFWLGYRRGLHDGVLFLAPAVPDLPRPAEGRKARDGSCARITLGDADSAHPAVGRRDIRRRLRL